MKRTKDDYSATVERGNRNSQPDKLPSKPADPMTSSPRPKANPRASQPPKSGMTSSPRPKSNPRNTPTTPKKPSKPRYV
jgi:hypothetical protein